MRWRMPARAGARGFRLYRHRLRTDGAEAARAQWRRIADQLRPKLPKLAGFLDEAEVDVLA